MANCVMGAVSLIGIFRIPEYSADYPILA